MTIFVVFGFPFLKPKEITTMEKPESGNESHVYHEKEIASLILKNLILYRFVGLTNSNLRVF